MRGCLWPSVRGLRQTRRQPLRSDLTHIPVVSDYVYASLPQSMGRMQGFPQNIYYGQLSISTSVNGAECRGFPKTYTTASSLSLRQSMGRNAGVSPRHLLRPALYLYLSQWGRMQGFPYDTTTAGSLYISQWGVMQGFPYDTTTAGSLLLYVSQWGIMQGFPQDIYYGRLSVTVRQSMWHNGGVSP